MSEEYINYNELEDMEYLCKLLEQRDEDIKTFKFTITTQQQMIDELIGKLDKAIEYIKEHTKETNFDNDKLIDILEILGGNNETI